MPIIWPQYLLSNFELLAAPRFLLLEVVFDVGAEAFDGQTPVDKLVDIVRGYHELIKPTARDRVLGTERHQERVNVVQMRNDHWLRVQFDPRLLALLDQGDRLVHSSPTSDTSSSTATPLQPASSMGCGDF
jgi:hypothetical protein